MLTLAWVPLMACQKSMSITYSRSAPFSAEACASPAAPPPKNCEKISRKPPDAEDPVSVRLPPAPEPREVGEVEAAEIHVGMRRLAGSALARGVTVVRVEADLVVHLALLGIAQNVVGFLDVLETIFGGFVAGVQIGVVFARELPVGLTDFVRVGFAGNTESFVVLVPGSSGHKKRAGLARPLQHYFLSSTSTNSASTTLSFPSFLPSSGAPPAPSPDGGAPGWEEADLYMASASLWLAVVSLSVVELIRAGSFSAMAFLTS